MAIVFKFICVGVITYAVFLVLMIVFQRGLMYHPSRQNPFSTDISPFQVLAYTTPMGLNMRGVYYPAQLGKPTIAYFHGNAGTLADRFFKASEFIPHGYGFAIVGYRGYSGNPGSPSEQGFYEDARAFIAAIKAKNVAEKDIILYGESLGTGVATQMATEMPDVKALVLEAPFTSVVDVGAERFWFLPVRKVTKDRFDSAAKIGDLRMPILIIHGKKDLTVPYYFGQRLFSLVRSQTRQFVSFEAAGHGDLYQHNAGEAIRAFLAKL